MSYPQRRGRYNFRSKTRGARESFRVSEYQPNKEKQSWADMTEEEETKNYQEQRDRRQDEKKKLTSEFYLGPRDQSFVNFIREILLKVLRIPDEKVEGLITKQFDFFVQAFTHPSVSASSNYEILELLGDSLLTFCIFEYLVKRFPHLEDPSGKNVPTLSRLKTNFVSKKIYGECAKTLGFLPYISSDLLTRKENEISLLEDVFEAFARAVFKGLSNLENLRSDMMISTGPILRLLQYVFDGKDISLEYEHLYDSRSILKELLERMKKGVPEINTTRKYDRSSGRLIFTSEIKIPNGNISVWGRGDGMTKMDSVQNACSNAIFNLSQTEEGKQAYDSLRKK